MARFRHLDNVLAVLLELEIAQKLAVLLVEQSAYGVDIGEDERGGGGNS